MCFDAHNTDVFAFKQTTRLLSALDAAFRGVEVTYLGSRNDSVWSLAQNIFSHKRSVFIQAQRVKCLKTLDVGMLARMLPICSGVRS